MRDADVRYLWLMAAQALICQRRKPLSQIIEALGNALRLHPPHHWRTGARLFKVEE